jgi:hypothetical protein
MVPWSGVGAEKPAAAAALERGAAADPAVWLRLTVCAPSDGSMLESQLCVSADGETVGTVDAMYGAATNQV